MVNSRDYKQRNASEAYFSKELPRILLTHQLFAGIAKAKKILLQKRKMIPYNIRKGFYHPPIPFIL